MPGGRRMAGIRTDGTRILIIAWCLFCLLLPAGTALAGTDGPLRLGVPLFAADAEITEAFADRLNKYLRADDVLFVRGNPKTVSLLKRIKQGKVALIRQSLGDLKKDLAFLLSQKVKIDYLCYNPEAWKSSHTPQEEKDDPVGAVKKARLLADEHSLGLIIVPDTAITLLAYGAAMAPYADIFAVQFQRWQLLEADKFQGTVTRTIEWVRTGNPQVPLFAQLAVNPPVHRLKGYEKKYATAGADEIMAKVRVIERYVYGVGFLLQAEGNGFERFFEFLEMLRPVVH